jgi:uncharacterized protein YndB with AHSA1/START domain
MTEPAATRSVVIEREVPHSPEKVWRALTQPALIAEWLMKNDFQLVQGHRFQLRTEPVAHWNGVIDCEVLMVEPGKRLCYSWAALGVQTVVTLTLTATPTGTHLRMEQSGFGANQEANYQGAVYGWRRFLDGLERVAAGLD